MASAVQREQDLEQKCVQLELDWERRCEEVRAEHYLKSEELIHGLTQSREKASYISHQRSIKSWESDTELDLLYTRTHFSREI